MENAHLPCTWVFKPQKPEIAPLYKYDGSNGSSNDSITSLGGTSPRKSPLHTPTTLSKAAAQRRTPIYAFRQPPKVASPHVGDTFQSSSSEEDTSRRIPAAPEGRRIPAAPKGRRRFRLCWQRPTSLLPLTSRNMVGFRFYFVSILGFYLINLEQFLGCSIWVWVWFCGRMGVW
jgi:hypothetical protein